MNKKFVSSSIIITLFSILFFASCSSVYMPNVPTSSMLSAKGELYSSAHISLKGNVNINGAYAISDHVGVLLNGSFINQDQRRKDFRQNLFETGAGYFTTFGEGKRILEIYGGLGTGSTDRIFRTFENDGTTTTDNQEVRFNKLFLQVNYSSKEKKSLRLFGKDYPLNYGTVIRLSQVNMNNFTRNDISQPLEDNIFIEPVFFTRLKVNQAVQIQYTSGSNFGLKNRDFLTAGNSVFTIGLVVNVGGMKLN